MGHSWGISSIQFSNKRSRVECKHDSSQGPRSPQNAIFQNHRYAWPNCGLHSSAGEFTLHMVKETQALYQHPRILDLNLEPYFQFSPEHWAPLCDSHSYMYVCGE